MRDGWKHRSREIVLKKLQGINGYNVQKDELTCHVTSEREAERKKEERQFNLIPIKEKLFKHSHHIIDFHINWLHLILCCSI